MTAPSSPNLNRRGRALPSCGRGVSVPTSTKPKPSLSIAPGTSAFLSKPAASPSGLGNFSPRISTARRGSEEGALAERSDLQGVDRRPMGRLRRQAFQNGACDFGQAHAARLPKTWRAVRAKRQRARPDDGAHRQGGVKMREERAAPRRLPAQVRTQGFGVDRRQGQVASAGEPFRRRLRGLIRGRKMDESVGAIDRRAGKDAGRLGLGPFFGRNDLIDNHSQPRPPRSASRVTIDGEPLLRGTTPPSVQRPRADRISLTPGASVSKAQAPRAGSCRSAAGLRFCAPRAARWCGRGRRSVGQFPAASAGSASWRETSPLGAV